mmetsp:Transcript_21344/g.45630  ORF Transcript_21344/g.45630 Transcript_21344/m.45630 type:complete len:187 (-) Transcript_21344:676-1236(-)
MSVVIAAFDNLCPLIRRKNSPTELKKIVADLKAVFGAHLSMLARLLPTAALLIPELNAVSFDRGETSKINLTSIYFTLQLFMRVVSSKTHPIMLSMDLHLIQGSAAECPTFLPCPVSLSSIYPEMCRTHSLCSIGSLREVYFKMSNPCRLVQNLAYPSRTLRGNPLNELFLLTFHNACISPFSANP